MTDLNSNSKTRRNRKPSDPFVLQARKSYGSYNGFEPQPEKKQSKPSTRFSSRLSALILAVVFFSSAATLVYTPFFQIWRPEIFGMEGINTEEISYFSGVQNVSVVKVDPAMIERILSQRYPQLKAVNVTIRFPNRVHIMVQPRKTVVKWSFGGSSFWIDEEGYVVSESQNPDRNEVQVLANSFLGARTADDRHLPTKFSRDALSAILKVAKYLPEGKRLFFTYEDGFGWDTDFGWRLFVGKSAEKLDEKLAMEQGLATYFELEQFIPDMVSLEFTNAPYYRFSE